MTQALTTKRNPYWKKRKNSTVYTPKYVSEFLHEIIHPVLKPKIIVDPAIGRGALTNPWRKESVIIGVDIDAKSKSYADHFIRCKFEDLKQWNFWRPDLILCNPPFNGAGGNKLYPEIFLRKIVELFGTKVPIVLFVPMGFRLNQKTTSKRWRWLKSTGIDITSIISLPLDVFENVEFHTEVLIFNLPMPEAHYWLDDVAMAA